MGDIWDLFEERARKRAARPWYQKLWSWLACQGTHLWHRCLSPASVWRRFFRFCQRRRRGFDDGELWDLHSTIMEFTLPRLRRFREVSRVGWPGPEAIFDISHEKFEGLSNEEKEDLNQRSLEEWDRMLGKMIRAHELWLREHGSLFIKENPDWREGDPWGEKYVEDPEAEAEFEEGWKIYQEWFFALWD